MARMDTTRFSGPRTVTIFVQFDSPAFDEVRLWVTANGRSDFAVSPDGFAFGQVKRGTAPEAAVTVNFYGTDLKVTEAKTESNYIKTTITEAKGENGTVSYVVKAKLRGDTPVGKWYTDIWLPTNNPSTPRVRVPLTVEVQTALSVSPPSAVLGEVKAGETAERKIVVRGSKPFRIIGVRGTDGQITIQDNAKESKPVHVLTVKFKAAKPGAADSGTRSGDDSRAHV